MKYTNSQLALKLSIEVEKHWYSKAAPDHEMINDRAISILDILKRLDNLS